MKRWIAIALSVLMMFSMVACSNSSTEESNSEEKIGAFEITAAQRELAKSNSEGLSALDAGRGNPNWINTQSRYAFSRFMDFAVQECERTLNYENMAGQAQKDGIGARFDAAMNPSDSTDAFLINAVNYCVNTLGMNKDDLLKELVDGIIGDYYPEPSRCMTNTEVILNKYLQSTLYHGENLADETQVFPTEGGSAAIVYIFNALEHNKLLKPNDKIAIAEPIFTPYLQIPHVDNYGLVSVDIHSNSKDNWDIPDDAFKTLEDPSIKAFFLVNPSNPASHQLSQSSLKKLKKVVEKNPNLIIITDDVYGTFTNDFQTVYSVVPHNTILVYSFSKLYGVTGWRVGLVAMNKKNVLDDLLKSLSKKDKEALEKEYEIVRTDPENMPFIERIVADSRSIGLYHTSGLSTPQQVFMDILALTHLVCENNDEYIELSKAVVAERHKALYDSLKLKETADPDDARYYALLNIEAIAKANFDKKFADWMGENVDDLSFLEKLAGKYGVVLMYGPGFNGPENSIRVSLANLNKEDYNEIGRRILLLMNDYHREMLQKGNKK